MISSRSPGTDAESGPWLFVVDPDCDITDAYELLRNFASIYPLRTFNKGREPFSKQLTVSVYLPNLTPMTNLLAGKHAELTFPAPI